MVEIYTITDSQKVMDHIYSGKNGLFIGHHLKPTISCGRRNELPSNYYSNPDFDVVTRLTSTLTVSLHPSDIVIAYKGGNLKEILDIIFDYLLEKNPDFQKEKKGIINLMKIGESEFYSICRRVFLSLNMIQQLNSFPLIHDMLIRLYGKRSMGLAIEDDVFEICIFNDFPIFSDVNLNKLNENKTLMNIDYTDLLVYLETKLNVRAVNISVLGEPEKHIDNRGGCAISCLTGKYIFDTENVILKEVSCPMVFDERTKTYIPEICLRDGVTINKSRIENGIFHGEVTILYQDREQTETIDKLKDRGGLKLLGRR